MSELFPVVTFVSKEALAAGMREPFEAAGFTRFTMLRGGPAPLFNDHSPRSAERRRRGLVPPGCAPRPGSWIEDLASRVHELDRLDPTWVVAGNAGGGRTEIVLNISDPHGTFWHDDLPRKVNSLDENFLILNTKKSRAARRPCPGFIYGTDACLNALKDGGACYVVDFRLTHLSAGGLSGYWESIERFRETWSPQFLAALRSDNEYVGCVEPQRIDRPDDEQLHVRSRVETWSARRQSPSPLIHSWPLVPSTKFSQAVSLPTEPADGTQPRATVPRYRAVVGQSDTDVRGRAYVGPQFRSGPSSRREEHDFRASG